MSKLFKWFRNHPKFQKMMDEAARKVRYDYEVLGKQYTPEDVENLVKMMYDKYGDIEIGVVKNDNESNKPK